MNLYFDQDGQPISRDEAIAAFENFSARNVARTNLPGGVIVSTVWLVADHGYGEGGAPVIFETMVRTHEGWVDQRRYCTRDEALAGHRATVEEYADKLLPHYLPNGKLP